MRALVTGAAGFVGSALALKLKSDGWDVVGIDSFTPYYDLSVKNGNVRQFEERGIQLLHGDLGSSNISRWIDGTDVVFHQAGQPGVRGSWGAKFTDYVHNNVLATQRLLESIKDVGASCRVVYASSSSVYGNASIYPVTETDLPKPASPYGVTKFAAEHLMTLYATEWGVNSISLRYFTVYGPRQRPDMAFTRFCIAILNGQEIVVYGDGEQVRDFTYVDDVVAANCLAASGRVLAGSVANVCGGNQVSVLEVIRTLEELSGRKALVSFRPRLSGDVARTGGSSAFLKDQTGWEPKVSLVDGLARQLAWAEAVSKSS